MNYGSAFYGQSALPEQPMIDEGTLCCVYTGKVFHNSIVDAYNQYTQEFNRSSDRATQEFLLDQRHRFIHANMYEALAEKRELEQKQVA